jgi:hypothetical protein
MNEIRNLKRTTSRYESLPCSPLRRRLAKPFGTLPASTVHLAASYTASDFTAVTVLCMRGGLRASARLREAAAAEAVRQLPGPSISGRAGNRVATWVRRTTQQHNGCGHVGGQIETNRVGRRNACGAGQSSAKR